MPRVIFLIAFVLFCRSASARDIRSFADSIRKTSHIPELAYAVVSADSVYISEVIGLRKAQSDLHATPEDRFRLGSNTKGVTGVVAAHLVREGKIKWTTRFFDLFPELKKISRPEHHNLTLADLLLFRTRLFMYTYTYAEPTETQFSGSRKDQRYQFVKWFMQQPPVKTETPVNFSNLSYVAAGLMLEKASGRTFQDLVNDLGEMTGAHFGFGRPNALDSMQTTGHNSLLVPETTGNDTKLEWLMAAGNINASLGDYISFVREIMRGLKGKSAVLSKSECEFLLYSKQRFSIGWLPATDNVYGRYAWNVGNPGTFLSRVYIFGDAGKTIILFANVQSDRADAGLDILYNKLKTTFF